MRRLLVFLVVLALVLIAADVGVRALAEDQLSRRLQTELELSRRPEVSLGGFPFIPGFVGGNIPSASVTAPELRVRGLSMRRVRLSLRGLSFSLVGILLGDQRAVSVARGEGTASVTADGLTQILRDRGFPATVRLASGRAFVSAEVLPEEVEADVSLSGGSILLRPAGGMPPVTLSVDIPNVVPGLRYKDLRLRGSEAVLSFRLRKARLRVV